MSDVNANIGVHIDTSAALAELKALQRQIATFHSQISKSSATAAAAQQNLATNLMNAINATGKFRAQMGVVKTSTESFTDSLERNKFSMREYFRYAGASTKTFGKIFKTEFDTIGKVAEERVKRMQTQYIKMGRDANGAMRSIAVTPLTLDMKNLATQTALNAQKQQLFNQLVKQGSTNLLNFGKNTQWAGRQLMVGFSIPLAYFGTTAAKVFMDLEAQAIKFRRVYGEMFTTTEETNKALADIESLAKEFTKYGVAVSKTMEMAASAAAMGKTGAELTAQVAQATRLAVLGGVEQQQALDTTISLTNAFGLAAEDLTGKINFLNAVENQTVTAIEDLTIAIPKAGPVVQGLGGSVEDLAFFLTAMREGGINASEGANALKSGLASLINPTDKAAAMLSKMGIDINAIIEGNFGNLRETVIDFSAALDTLAPLERSRAIEQLFGKFQFARLDALFTNVAKEGGQAARVLELAGKSVEELAIISERELKAVEDAVGTNFKAAVEELKLAIAPIGKTFLQAVTPIVRVVGDLLEKFNNLGDGTKKFIVIASTLIGIIGPTFLMTFGLVANGVANVIKLFLALRGGFLKLTGNSKILAEQTNYLNSEQLEAATVAASLNQRHNTLIQTFTQEAAVVKALRDAYVSATIAATRFAASNPGMMSGGLKKTPKFARGTTGVTGGKAGKDSILSLLMPGEAVVPTDIAQDDRFKPIIEALVSGDIKKFAEGTVNVGGRSFTTQSVGSAARLQAKIAELIAAGMSEQKIIAALEKNIERGRPMTASALVRRLSIGRGAGMGSSAPAGISKLAKQSQSGFLAEKRAIKEVLKRKGIVLTPSQEKNLFTTQASHLTEERDAGGKKIWRASNLVADQGYVNNYLNTVKGKLGKNLLSMSDDQLRALGINRDELKALAAGNHPRTASAATTLRAVAQYDASINPRSYQAQAVLAGLEYRSKTGFYQRPLKTLSEIAASGRSAVVSRKTGAKVPSGAKVVGGKASDTVMAAKTPGELTVSKKSASALRSGKPVFVPGFGKLRLAGFAEGDPAGQKPLSQAQIRAAQEGTSLNEAKKKIAAEKKLIESIDKQKSAIDDTTKSTKNLGEKFAKGANVITGVSIAASFLGGPIGELAQKITPFVVLLSTISMLAPGLKSGFLKLGAFLVANPFVALAAAVAAVAIGFKILDEKNKKQARAQSDYIDTISATTEKMKRVGEITGRVGASEIMARRREGQTADKFTTGYNRAGQQFGTTFLESEVGKEILTNFQTNLTKGGTTAAKQIALELSSYVSDGIMTAEEANSVARSIGVNMSNMSIAANIQGELRSIIGPDGQDLAVSPLKVRIAIAEQSGQTFNDLVNQYKDLTKNDSGLMASIGAAGTQSLEAINAQRDAQAKMYDDKLRELQLEKQKTTDKNEQLRIDNEIKDVQYKRNQDDKKFGDLRAKQLKKEVAAYKDLNSGSVVDFVETAFFEAKKQQVRTKFEGDPFTNLFFEAAAKGSKAIGDQQVEITFLSMVGAGDLTPQTATNLYKMFEGKETELDAVIKTKTVIENPDKFAQLANIAGGLKGKKAKAVGIDIITQLTAQDGADKLDDRLAALTLLQQMDGKEINVAAFLEGDITGKLDKLVPLLNKIEDQKEINIEVLQKIQGETGMDLSGLIADWEHYVNLPADVQKTATQTYTVIYQTIGDKELAAEFSRQTGGNLTAAGFLAERTDKTAAKSALAAKLTKEQFAAGQAKNVIPKGKNKGDGTDKDRDTTLDALLNRLKFIRKASINAVGGVNELMKITSGDGLAKFGGVAQQLMEGPKGGFNREFIEFLENMDDKTRKTYMNVKDGRVELTKQGKALKEAFNEKAIGEYQIVQKQSLQDTLAQRAAFLRLRAAGIDNATALEMVADATLAVAINSKSISPAELKEMAKAAKEAADESERLNLALKNTAEESRKNIQGLQTSLKALQTATSGKLSDILGPDFAKLTKQQLELIANSPELQKGILQVIDFKGSKEEFALLVQDIKDMLTNEEFAIKVKSQIEAIKSPVGVLQGQFDEISAGFSQYFSNLRLIVDANFRARIRQAEKNVQLAQREVDRIQKSIDSIQEKIDVEQRNLELEVTRKIEEYQEEVSDLQRQIEMQYDRPISALQEESSDLSEQLTILDKAAEEVNKKYDAQAEALNKVAEANQRIIDQQKKQISLADALSQGDISAAAQAVQDIREANAAASATSSQDMLEAARQAELNNLRSVTGLTRAQIAERQYQIERQIYALEEARELIQTQILAKQDAMYLLEEERERRLLIIRGLEDQIYQKTKDKNGELYRANQALQAAQDALTEINDKYQDALDAIALQEDQWLAVQAKIAAAEVAAFNFTEQLKRAWEIAKQLAAAMSGGAVVTGAPQFEGISPELQKKVNDAFTKAKDAQKKADDAEKKADNAFKELDEANDRYDNAVDNLNANLAEYKDLQTQRDALSAGLKKLTGLVKSGKTKSAKKLAADLLGGSGGGGGGGEMMMLSRGGFVKPKYFASGGFARGTDKIPAMLSPGEFIMSRYAVDNYGVDRLKAINSGQYDGSSVYNYSVNVNVDGSNSDANDIARAVIKQIQQLDGQRIRRQAV